MTTDAEPTTDLILCPTCYGKGAVDAYVTPKYQQPYTETRRCPICLGQGEIDQDALALVVAGLAMRQERKRKGQSVRTAARFAGLSVEAYLAKERGEQA